MRMIPLYFCMILAQIRPPLLWNSRCPNRSSLCLRPTSISCSSSQSLKSSSFWEVEAELHMVLPHFQGAETVTPLAESGGESEGGIARPSAGLDCCRGRFARRGLGLLYGGRIY